MAELQQAPAQAADPVPTPQRREKLWKLLRDGEIYSKDLKTFTESFADPERRQKLYKLLQEGEVYSKDYNEFSSSFFSDIDKAKAPAQPAPAPAPAEETPVAAAPTPVAPPAPAPAVPPTAPVVKYEEEFIDTPNVRTENSESFKKGRSLKNNPQLFVLHHTGATDERKNGQQVKGHFTNPDSETSAHVVIEEDGKRTVYASPDQVAFHAGVSKYKGRENVNDFSIGIEFQGDTNKKPLTDKQIDSFIEYALPVMKQYNISPEEITTHALIAPDRKADVNDKEYKRVLQAVQSAIEGKPFLNMAHLGEAIVPTDEEYLANIRRQGEAVLPEVEVNPTDEQLQELSAGDAAIQGSQGQPEWVQQTGAAATGFVNKFTKLFTVDVLDFVAEGATQADRAGMGEADAKAEDKATFKLARILEKGIDSTFKVDPKYKNSLATTTGETLGTMTGTLMTASKSVATKGIEALAKSPGMLRKAYAYAARWGVNALSQPAIMGAISAGAENARQVREEAAQAKGMTEDEYVAQKLQQGDGTDAEARQTYKNLTTGDVDDMAWKTLIRTAPIEMGTDGIPIGRLLDRMNEVLKGSLKAQLLQRGANALTGGVEGFLSESIEKAFENMAVRDVYDTTVRLTDGLIAEGGMGAGLQGVLSLLLTGVRARGKRPGLTTKQQEVIAQTVEVLETKIDNIEENTAALQQAAEKDTGDPVIEDAQVVEDEPDTTDYDENFVEDDDLPPLPAEQPAAPTQDDIRAEVQMLQQQLDNEPTKKGKATIQKQIDELQTQLPAPAAVTETSAPQPPAFQVEITPTVQDAPVLTPEQEVIAATPEPAPAPKPADPTPETKTPEPDRYEIKKFSHYENHLERIEKYEKDLADLKAQKESLTPEDHQKAASKAGYKIIKKGDKAPSGKSLDEHVGKYQKWTGGRTIIKSAERIAQDAIDNKIKGLKKPSPMTPSLEAQLKADDKLRSTWSREQHLKHALFQKKVAAEGDQSKLDNDPEYRAIVKELEEPKAEPETTTPTPAPEPEAGDNPLKEGSKITWNEYGNGVNEWTVGKKVKTRNGKDAIELSRTVDDGAGGYTLTQVVALEDLNFDTKQPEVKKTTAPAPVPEVKTPETKAPGKPAGKAPGTVAEIAAEADAADKDVSVKPATLTGKKYTDAWMKVENKDNRTPLSNGWYAYEQKNMGGTSNSPTLRVFNPSTGDVLVLKRKDGQPIDRAVRAAADTLTKRMPKGKVAPAAAGTPAASVPAVKLGKNYEETLQNANAAIGLVADNPLSGQPGKIEKMQKEGAEVIEDTAWERESHKTRSSYSIRIFHPESGRIVNISHPRGKDLSDAQAEAMAKEVAIALKQTPSIPKATYVSEQLENEPDPEEINQKQPALKISEADRAEDQEAGQVTGQKQKGKQKGRPAGSSTKNGGKPDGNGANKRAGNSKSKTDGLDGRVTAAAKGKPIALDDNTHSQLEKNGLSTEPLQEIGDPALFIESAAEAQKRGKKSGHIVPTAVDLNGAKVYVTPDGMAGVAIKNGQIVGLFARSNKHQRMGSLLVRAVQMKARKITVDNAEVAQIVSMYGFKADGAPDADGKIKMKFDGGDPNTLADRISPFHQYQEGTRQEEKAKKANPFTLYSEDTSSASRDSRIKDKVNELMALDYNAKNAKAVRSFMTSKRSQLDGQDNSRLSVWLNTYMRDHKPAEDARVLSGEARSLALLPHVKDNKKKVEKFLEANNDNLEDSDAKMLEDWLTDYDAKQTSLSAQSAEVSQKTGAKTTVTPQTKGFSFSFGSSSTAIPVNAVPNLGDVIRHPNADVEQRLVDSGKASIKEFTTSFHGLIQWTKDLHSSFVRRYVHLDGRLFARDTDILRKIDGLPKTATHAAINHIKAMVNGMTPEQYDTFRRKIVVEDLISNFKRGLEIDGTGHFGIKTLQEAQDYLATRIDPYIAKEPTVKDALDARDKTMRKLYSDLVEAGLLKQETEVDANGIEVPVYREYFHRRKLQIQVNDAMAKLISKKSLAEVKRDFQFARTQNETDYSTNFIESEFKVYVDSYLELEKKRKHDQLLKPYKKKEAAARRKAKKAYEAELATLTDPVAIQEFIDGKKAYIEQMVEDLLPGHVAWSAEQNKYRLFRVDAVDSRHIEATLNSMLNNPNLTGALALSKLQDLADHATNMYGITKNKGTMIPAELAQTLNEMGRPIIHDALGRGLKALTTRWKIMQLLAPHRVVKYWFNNIVSDIDAALQADPAIIFKHGLSSIKELVAYTKHGKMSQDIAHTIDQQVIASGYGVSEIGETSHLDFTRRLVGRIKQPPTKNPFKAVYQLGQNVRDSYMSKVEKLGTFRENILRLAAYKRALEKLENGKAPYWASKKVEIDQMIAHMNTLPPAAKAAYRREIAGKLAREVMIDYGNISEAGQRLRETALPFYSWMEGNTSRQYNLFKNAANPVVHAKLVSGLVIRGATRALAESLVAYMYYGLFSALVNLWNNTAHPDIMEEMELTEAMGLQFVLGRTKDGKARVIPIQGAMIDFFDFLGIPEVASRLWKGDDWQKDDTELDKTGKLIELAAKQVGERLVNSVTPVIKGPAEQTFGAELFPKPFQPRPMKDRLEHAAGVVGLKDFYKLWNGTPSAKTESVGAFLLAQVTKEIDTREQAYYDAMGIVDRLKGKTSFIKGELSELSDDKRKAMYNYQRARRLKNSEKASRFMKEFYKAGGTDEDLETAYKNADPLRGLNEDEKADVENRILGLPAETDLGKRLTKRDVKVFKIALKYYASLE